MEQEFNLLVSSRANYYTKGCPVQFVLVELLKGEETGDIAVCLSFKNIAEQVLDGLTVLYRCKDRAGQIICEDHFTYQGLAARLGDVFGGEDAVYISTEPIGSVEVELEQATLADGRVLPLKEYKRTRLPAPRPLPLPLAKQLTDRTGKQEMKYVPQIIDQGWYCACGAFHPNEENTVYCSECGCDRILLQNALSGMLQQNHGPEPEAPSEPTAVKLGDAQEAVRTAPYHGAARQEPDAFAAQDEERTRYRPGTRRELEEDYDEEPYEELDEDEEELSDDDLMAANIIRWAPPITVILCALVIAFTVVFHLIAQ